VGKNLSCAFLNKIKVVKEIPDKYLFIWPTRCNLHEYNDLYY